MASPSTVGSSRPSAPGRRTLPGLILLLGVTVSSPSGLITAQAPEDAQGQEEARAQDEVQGQPSDDGGASNGEGALVQEPDSRDRVARASRLQGELTIDGRLDEAIWQEAEPVTGFTQVEPDEGEPAEEPTEVRILYDEENIYLGARMFDSDTSRIEHQLTRRDQTGRAAGYFEFSFDSNFDRTTGYTFRVTAAGVQRDEYVFDDTSSERAWDGVWESDVSFTADGWIAEVRIPLSQLRYEPSPEPQVWGVNFARRRIAANERSEWAFVPIGTSGDASRWGRLEGLMLPERSRYAEILPYVMSGLEWAPAEPNNPFFDGTDATGQLGADLRYGLGSTFVLDATVNPDFGQVEVDPRVINLSAFETFFPEQRPFFTRDDRLFDFSLSGGPNNLFHSRRIGRSPQGNDPSDAEFTTSPGETTILGAAKLTGRTEGGLSVGALAAVTGREEGQAFYPGEPEGERIESFVVEPRTVYGTVRLQQDFREGQSRVGGIVTGVDRSLPSSGELDFLPGEAYSGGFDFEHTWSDREWALWGFLAGSHVRGSREAILGLQRSSNHYFQRPDQDYLELDPTATSLSGAEWRLQLERRSGRHWTGAVWIAERTPGFEVDDIGFSNATERLDGGARIEYQEPVPGDVFRDYRFQFSTFHNWRHSVLDDGILSASSWGHAHKNGQASLRADFTFLNWWGMELEYEYRPEVLSDVLTRGGPLMVDPGASEFGIGGSTDRRDDVTVDAEIEFSSGTRGGNGFEARFGVEARPTNGIVVSVGPSYERTLDQRQYVTVVEDASFAPTYGSRYVFADLWREELSLDTRLNVIFSPDLSLELFVQPLISTGDYRTYKELSRSESFDFREYVEGMAVDVGGELRCQGGDLCRSDGRIHLDTSGDGVPETSFGPRSFNVRSLRGNAVLRWEYMPGSRIYLVWQQDRRGLGPGGIFDFGRDAGALFDAPGEHRFMIKVDHWIDL